MEPWNIISVSMKTMESGVVWWEVRCEVPTDISPSGILPCMSPHKTFENYAGQFGIDPDDSDTLVDSVIYDHMLAPLRAKREIPMIFPGRVGEDEAREMLLTQISDIKRVSGGGMVQRSSQLRIASMQEDLLDGMRTNAKPDRERVAVLQFNADEVRKSNGVNVTRSLFVNGKNFNAMKESRATPTGRIPLGK